MHANKAEEDVPHACVLQDSKALPYTLPPHRPTLPSPPSCSRSWMDKNVVQPYIAPLMDKEQGGGGA